MTDLGLPCQKAVCHNEQSASLLSSLELSHVPKYVPSFSLSAPCILLTLTRRLRFISNPYFDTPSPKAGKPRAKLSGKREPSGFPDSPGLVFSTQHKPDYQHAGYDNQHAQNHACQGPEAFAGTFSGFPSFWIHGLLVKFHLQALARNRNQTDDVHAVRQGMQVDIAFRCVQGFGQH